MNIETRSRKAFEDVTAALRNIERFRESRGLDSLKNAESDLKSALAADSEYLSAVFYSGVVQDLIGRPKDAAPFFERILDEGTDARFRDETQYNLGVAYYHRYSHEWLEKAERHFLEVIRLTGDQILRTLAQANLAQTYAMWMIPSFDQLMALVESPRDLDVEDHIQDKFDKHGQYYADVQSILEARERPNQDEDEDWTRIEATVKNARGMALMYYTDYGIEDRAVKVDRLRESLEMLRASGESVPNDWAYTCDLASVHMRLGVHIADEAESERLYREAIDLLEKVVKDLRPEYGFALYEIGRTYRVWGQFSKAIAYFDRALRVDEAYRDVSTKRVEYHRQRAMDRDQTYP